MQCFMYDLISSSRAELVHDGKHFKKYLTLGIHSSFSAWKNIIQGILFKTRSFLQTSTFTLHTLLLNICIKKKIFIHEIKNYYGPRSAFWKLLKSQRLILVMPSYAEGFFRIFQRWAILQKVFGVWNYSFFRYCLTISISLHFWQSL